MQDFNVHGFNKRVLKLMMKIKYDYEKIYF